MSSPALLTLLAALALLAAAAALFLTLRRPKEEEGARALEALRGELAARAEGVDRRQEQLQSLVLQQLTAVQGLLQERLSGQEAALRGQLSTQSAALQGQTAILQKHMEGTQATLSLLREKMGEIQQTGAHMAELGREMESLQRLLKAPKARGELGEVGLRSILDDILPQDSVEYQHAFSDGEKVDALIRLERGAIPLDAKFPLEDFQRYLEAPDEERPKARKALRDNLKKKIDSVAKKYIRPGEGTLPLALMYLPAESLYYEVFAVRERDEEDLWAYAQAKSVLPLSPGTITAYLKAVAMGLRAAAVEKNARQVIELLQTLERDLSAGLQPFEVLGGHLSNAQKKYAESAQLFQRFKEHLERARDLGGEE